MSASDGVTNATEAQPVIGKRLSLRDEQKLMTRGRILDGALEVFEHKGYPEATIDDITQAAGASRATFYLHFKSKFDVIRALYTKRQPEVEQILTGLDEAIGEGSWDSFKAWVSETLAWHEANRVFTLALEQALVIEGSEAGGLRRRYADLMPNFAEKWAGRLRGEADMRVWLLGKTLSTTFIMWRVDGIFSEVDRDSLVNALTDLYWGGLMADAPGRVQR